MQGKYLICRLIFLWVLNLGQGNNQAQPRSRACGNYPRTQSRAKRLCQLLPDSKLRKGIQTGDKLGKATTTLHPVKTVEKAKPTASQAQTAGLPPTVSVHQDAKLAQRGITTGPSGNTQRLFAQRP
jgi:hypothetical protein